MRKAKRGKYNSGLFAIILYAAFSVQQAGAQDSRTLTPSQWREDLQFMAAQLLRIHPAPDSDNRNALFKTDVENLHERIPGLKRHEIILEFHKLCLRFEDGHTGIPLIPDYNPNLRFHRLPIIIEKFTDGLHVVSVKHGYESILGGHVIKIGNLDAENAYKKVRSISRGENLAKYQTLRSLAMPEVLQSLRIIKEVEKTDLLIQTLSGDQINISLPPMATEDSSDWIDANRNSKAPHPLWLKNNNKAFWFDYIEDKKLLYFQFNAVQDTENESFAAFCQRMFNFVEDKEVDRFVIDLRQNGGGNNLLNKSLIHGLIKGEKINQRGKLFTIIGQHTFSAALNCATDLERHTQTIFVGEPTQAKPNHYGDATFLMLPHSNQLLFCSTLYWQKSLPWDSRLYIDPDMVVLNSSHDYRENRDPALDAILDYTSSPEVSLMQVLISSLLEDDYSNLEKKTRDFKEKYEGTPFGFTEWKVNSLARVIMSRGFSGALELFELDPGDYEETMDSYQADMNAVIALLKLNTSDYPNSADAHYELAEALLDNSQTDLAVDELRKTQTLDLFHRKATYRLDQIANN